MAKIKWNQRYRLAYERWWESMVEREFAPLSFLLAFLNERFNAWGIWNFRIIYLIYNLVDFNFNFAQTHVA